MLKTSGLVNLSELKMYVNGEWTAALNGETLPVTNPSTGKVVARIPNGGRQETHAAIAAAEEAFKTLSKLTAQERSKYLKILHDLMHEYKDELAEIMSMEMGKPLTEARGEVDFAASYLMVC